MHALLDLALLINHVIVTLGIQLDHIINTFFTLLGVITT